MAQQDLFDTLAGSFGHGVDRGALNAFVANSQSLNGLRTAQTEEALNNATKQQEEMQAHSELESSLSQVLGDDGKPLLTPSGAHLVATELKGHFGDAKTVMEALRATQLTHNTGVISNPANLATPAATAAIAGNTNKMPATEEVHPEFTVPAGMPSPPTVFETPGGAANASMHNATAFAKEHPQMTPSLSDDAAYNAAVKYNRYGVMPTLGMGASAAADRKKVLEFAASISVDPNWTPPSWTQGPGNTPHAPAPGPAPGGPPAAPTPGAPATPAHPTLQTATDAAVNPSETKATAASLSDMVKRTSVADASEQTALKNLQIAREMLAKADQTGSPLANTIVNKIRAGMFGDPDVAAYHNAISTARNEYARVISMATGAQGITDHAMREGQKLFPDDLAPAQFEANVAVAGREMANRTGSMHDQISKLKTGLHTVPGGAAPPVTPSPAGPTPPGPEAPTVISLDEYLKRQGH